MHHAIHTALTGERIGYYEPYDGLHDVADAMQHAFVARGQVDSRGRRRGAPVPHADGNRFVAFAQNHDHVGNRAAGDRLVHQVGVERAMVAAAIVAFSPFTPLLFQGEEWGASSPFCFFADFDDRDLAEAVRRGRREEFAGFEWADDVPDPLSPETFARSRLEWRELAFHCIVGCSIGIAICSRSVERGQSSRTAGAISCPSTRSATTCSWCGAVGFRCLAVTSGRRAADALRCDPALELRVADRR